MEKTLLEKLKEARISNEPAYVSFFNNGEVRIDKSIANKRMTEYYLDDTIGSINYVFTDAAESYARHNPYDTISMSLELGLIYNKEDVDDENHIRENAEPLKGIVRCYTGDITSYLNGEKANEEGYYGYGKQGFVDYKNLVTTMRRNGIAFEGPETFDDFKEAILSGEQFDINLTASLKEPEKKEEPQVVVQDKPKKLSKIPFIRRS